MNKIILSSLVAAVIGSTGCVSITEREIFGKPVAIIKTRDLLSPCTTTVLDENLVPLTDAANPGLLPATSGGAGIAAAGYFLGRQRNHSDNSANVRVGGDSVSATGGNGNGSATGGSGFVPPGHQNNPSQNH